jgi:hypothetical protein
LCPPRNNRLVSGALFIAMIGAVAISAASVLWLGHDLRNLVVMARH